MEAAADARPDHLDSHLDRDAIPKDFGRMHLRDRRRRDRFAETCKEFAYRPAERRFDKGHRLLFGEGLHLVLEHGEIDGDVVADDIRPRRQKLAELDVGRTQPRNGIRQALGPAAAAGTATSKNLRHAPAESREPRELVARKCCDHSFADHDPARAHKPETGADRRHTATRTLKASSLNAARRCRPNSYGRRPGRIRLCGSKQRSCPG